MMMTSRDANKFFRLVVFRGVFLVGICGGGAGVFLSYWKSKGFVFDELKFAELVSQYDYIFASLVIVGLVIGFADFVKAAD